MCAACFQNLNIFMSLVHSEVWGGPCFTEFINEALGVFRDDRDAEDLNMVQSLAGAAGPGGIFLSVHSVGTF